MPSNILGSVSGHSPEGKPQQIVLPKGIDSMDTSNNATSNGNQPQDEINNTEQQNFHITQQFGNNKLDQQLFPIEPGTQQQHSFSQEQSQVQLLTVEQLLRQVSGQAFQSQNTDQQPQSTNLSQQTDSTTVSQQPLQSPNLEQFQSTLVGQQEFQNLDTSQIQFQTTSSGLKLQTINPEQQQQQQFQLDKNEQQIQPANAEQQFQTTDTKQLQFQANAGQLQFQSANVGQFQAINTGQQILIVSAQPHQYSPSNGSLEQFQAANAGQQQDFQAANNVQQQFQAANSAQQIQAANSAQQQFQAANSAQQQFQAANSAQQIQAANSAQQQFQAVNSAQQFQSTNTGQQQQQFQPTNIGQQQFKAVNVEQQPFQPTSIGQQQIQAANIGQQQLQAAGVGQHFQATNIEQQQFQATNSEQQFQATNSRQVTDSGQQQIPATDFGQQQQIPATDFGQQQQQFQATNDAVQQSFQTMDLNQQQFQLNNTNQQQTGIDNQSNVQNVSNLGQPLQLPQSESQGSPNSGQAQFINQNDVKNEQQQFQNPIQATSAATVMLSSVLDTLNVTNSGTLGLNTMNMSSSSTTFSPGLLHIDTHTTSADNNFTLSQMNSPFSVLNEVKAETSERSDGLLDLNSLHNHQNLFSDGLLNWAMSDDMEQGNTAVKHSFSDLSEPQEKKAKESESELMKILTSGKPSTDNTTFTKPRLDLIQQLQSEDTNVTSSMTSPGSISSPEPGSPGNSVLSPSVCMSEETQMTLIQKSGQLGLDDTTIMDTLNQHDVMNLFSECASGYGGGSPRKARKSSADDTPSCSNDLNSESVPGFDAKLADSSASFIFTKFGSDVPSVFTFGQQKLETTCHTSTSTSTRSSAKADTPKASKRNNSTTESDLMPPPMPTRKMKTPSLNLSFPAKHKNCELKIMVQPENQHRARYLTEGSRGSVKDQSQQGYPTVKLLGYTQPCKLQVFIGNDSGKVRPHGFYQACKVSGRNTRQCEEKEIEGTNVIEIDLSPEEDMTVSLDCVGILKLRNADVEKRIGLTRSKKKSTKARMIFRVYITNPDGTLITLQVPSTPILCTQPAGQPEICKKSLSDCKANTTPELFIIGKNFSRAAKVIFRHVDDAGSILWEKNGNVDMEYFQPTHLICTVPEYDRPLSEPITVQLIVQCAGKCSEPHTFTFNPDQEESKFEPAVPMDTAPSNAHIRKLPDCVAPEALLLNLQCQEQFKQEQRGTTLTTTIGTTTLATLTGLLGVANTPTTALAGDNNGHSLCAISHMCMDTETSQPSSIPAVVEQLNSVHPGTSLVSSAPTVILTPLRAVGINSVPTTSGSLQANMATADCNTNAFLPALSPDDVQSVFEQN